MRRLAVVAAVVAAAAAVDGAVVECCAAAVAVHGEQQVEGGRVRGALVEVDEWELVSGRGSVGRSREVEAAVDHDRPCAQVSDGDRTVGLRRFAGRVAGAVVEHAWACLREERKYMRRFSYKCKKILFWHDVKLTLNKVRRRCMNVRLLVNSFECDLIFAAVFDQFFGCYRFNNLDIVGEHGGPLRMEEEKKKGKKYDEKWKSASLFF